MGLSFLESVMSWVQRESDDSDALANAVKRLRFELEMVLEFNRSHLLPCEVERIESALAGTREWL